MIRHQLTPRQVACLRYLRRYPNDAHPSSHMRNRDELNPQNVLRRLHDRGLVTALGLTPEGRCYRITPMGQRVLAMWEAAE